jgi:hypothetical protein
MHRHLAMTASMLIPLVAASAYAQQLPDDEFEPNNSFAQATPWECGETTPILNIRDDDADIDYFVVEVTEDNQLLVATLETGFPGLLYLDAFTAILDEDGNLLDIAENWPGNVGVARALVDAGTYYIVITGWPDFGLVGTTPKDFGHYQLTVECSTVGMLAYEFGGGGTISGPGGQRGTMRLAVSGTAPDNQPFGPNSFEDLGEIEADLSLFVLPSRTLVESAGPFEYAAGIEFGPNDLIVLAQGPMTLNGVPFFGEVFVDVFLGPPFFEIFNFDTGQVVFSGFGVPGRSSFSLSLTPED